MKLLVLTTRKFAPTYNTKLLSQIEYIQKFSNIKVDVLIDAPLYEIEKIFSNSEYDLIYPTTVFTYTADGESIVSFNSYLYKLLDYYRQAYIGSPLFTHLLLNDKALTNYRSEMGLPNQIITRGAWDRSKDIVLARLSTMELPVIIKPNTLAASLGITEKSIVWKKEDFEPVITSLFQEFSNLTEVLSEKYLERSIEYTVSVTGNDKHFLVNVSKLKAKTAIHPLHSNISKNALPEKRAFEYDNENDRLLQYTLQSISEKLFIEFGLKDLGRFDFLYSDEGNLYLIDANTLPSLSNNYLFEFIQNHTLHLEQLLGLVVLVACKRIGLELDKKLLNTYPLSVTRLLF